MRKRRKASFIIQANAERNTTREPSYLLLLRPLFVVIGCFGCAGAFAGLGLAKANVVDQLVLTEWKFASFGEVFTAPMLDVSFGWVLTLSVALLYVIAMEIGPSGSMERFYMASASSRKGKSDNVANLEEENVASWKHECITGCS